jgi:ubiquinone/menaquinone biosynthesis C-methylase UbiE
MSTFDIGSGPGIWTLDMAQKYPQSSFVGIDISSMSPSSNNTPLNAIFLQHNITEGLPWPSNTFDFIYQRLMSLSFGQKDLTRIIHEIIRITKIDGWIEIMNFGHSLKSCGKATKKLMNAGKSLIIID